MILKHWVWLWHSKFNLNVWVCFGHSKFNFNTWEYIFDTLNCDFETQKFYFDTWIVILTNTVYCICQNHNSLIVLFRLVAKDFDTQECDVNTDDCDLVMLNMLSTRITVISIVINLTHKVRCWCWYWKVWFKHEYWDFDTQECDLNTNECIFDTPKCNFSNHECDFDTQNSNLILKSVIWLFDLVA
jgi:hypothetical protein